MICVTSLSSSEERIYTLTSAQEFFKLKCPYVSVDLCFCLSPRPVVIIGKVSDVVKNFLKTVDGCLIFDQNCDDASNFVENLLKITSHHPVINANRAEIEKLQKIGILPIIIHVRCTKKLETRIRKIENQNFEANEENGRKVRKNIQNKKLFKNLFPKSDNEPILSKIPDNEFLLNITEAKNWKESILEIITTQQIQPVWVDCPYDVSRWRQAYSFYEQLTSEIRQENLQIEEQTIVEKENEKAEEQRNQLNNDNYSDNHSYTPSSSPSPSSCTEEDKNTHNCSNAQNTTTNLNSLQPFFTTPEPPKMISAPQYRNFVKKYITLF